MPVRWRTKDLSWTVLRGTREEGHGIDTVAMTRSSIRWGPEAAMFVQRMEEAAQRLWVGRERQSTRVQEHAEVMWALEQVALEEARQIWPRHSHSTYTLSWL